MTCDRRSLHPPRIRGGNSPTNFSAPVGKDFRKGHNYRFDAWGDLLSSTGGTDNRQQYKGEYSAYRKDADAFQTEHRPYQPDQARFQSEDPAEAKLNAYVYCSNNPVNEADPSGLDPIDDLLCGEDCHRAQRGSSDSEFDWGVPGANPLEKALKTPERSTSSEWTEEDAQFWDRVYRQAHGVSQPITVRLPALYGDLHPVTLSDPQQIAQYHAMVAESEAQFHEQQRQAAMPSVRAMSAEEAQRAMRLDDLRRLAANELAPPGSRLFAEHELLVEKGDHFSALVIRAGIAVNAMPVLGRRGGALVSVPRTTAPRVFSDAGVRWTATRPRGTGYSYVSVPRTPIRATRQLADEIADIGPPRSRQTVALMETRQGQTIVSGGATDLTAAQKQLARQRGLLVAEDLPGFHAEITGVYDAGRRGLTPTRGVTTNQVCRFGESNCALQLKNLAGEGGFGFRLSPGGRSFEFVPPVGGR